MYFLSTLVRHGHSESPAASDEEKCEMEADEEKCETEVDLASEMDTESESTQVCVGVLGAANAGKSTLLNMLLGEELLPSSAGIETASICRITHDPSLKGEYHCSEDGSANRKTFLSAKDVTKWLKVINKMSDIPEVRVETAIKLLDGSFLDSRVNLKLIDVPGANEADNDKAREKIGSVLQTCNLILLIVKHEDVGTETVVQLAEMIRQNGRENSPVFVLVNKMDSIAEESERKKVQDIATQAYLDNTSLFGNRSVRIAFTKGKIGLASLCNGNNCRGDCPLPNAMLAVIFSMSNEERSHWFERLAMLHKTNERAEPEGEDPSDNLPNGVDLHREMQARVADFSGITPLYKELLRLLLVSINTIGVHELSSKELIDCGALSSLCKEMKTEKELGALLALVRAQDFFVDAMKHHEKLKTKCPDDYEILIQSWEAGEKIWRDAIEIFLSKEELACSQPEQSISDLVEAGVLSLGVKMLSPAGSRNQITSPEYRTLISDLQDYASFRKIEDLLIRLDCFEKGKAAIENCCLRSKLTVVSRELQSQIDQAFTEFLTMGKTFMNDTRGAILDQDELRKLKDSSLQLSKWCYEMHPDNHFEVFLTLVRGKQTLTVVEKFLSSTTHGDIADSNTWREPSFFDKNIETMRNELIVNAVPRQVGKLSQSKAALLKNLLQYDFFAQNSVQTILVQLDFLEKGLAAVASSEKNNDLIWKKELDCFSSKLDKPLSDAKEELFGAFQEFFSSLFEHGLHTKVENELKEECNDIVEWCKTMATEQELRKFLTLVKFKETLQMHIAVYPQCTNKLKDALENSLFPELQGSQENPMELLNECIMIVGCRMLQPSNSKLPWGLGFKVSGNLELKEYSNSLPDNLLRQTYYREYSAVLFTILASLEYFERARSALLQSISKMPPSSAIKLEFRKVQNKLDRSFTHSIETFLEKRLSELKVACPHSKDEEEEISRHLGISGQVGAGVMGAAFGAFVVGVGAALAGPVGFTMAAEAVGIAAGGSAGVAGVIGIVGASGNNGAE